MLFFAACLAWINGDYAPMVELAYLRKKHDFLLVIDDVKPPFLYKDNLLYAIICTWF